MNRDLHLADVFGTFCADGSRAAEFRMKEVEPFIHAYEVMVFDFTGVRNMNDSFANALIAPLVAQLPSDYRAKLRFKNCSDSVRVAIAGALSLGVERAREGGKTVVA